MNIKKIMPEETAGTYQKQCRSENKMKGYCIGILKRKIKHELMTTNII